MVQVVHSNTMDKVYPDSLDLAVGDTMERVPKDVFWICVEGSYPIYGRYIEDIIVVNDNKLTVKLGSVSQECNTKPSPSATLYLYGEFEDGISIWTP